MFQAIAQTAGGWLWVGTEQGLARFDGLKFAVFHPSGFPELATAAISALRVTSDKNLWIGTRDHGLVCLQDGKLSKPSFASKISNVLQLFEDADKTLWISAEMTYKQISGELGISMGTLYTYIRRIYDKLHVNCRTDAVVKYLGARKNPTSFDYSGVRSTFMS
ncbi:MAG: hypothetical protein JWM68_3989 [Verrucomicrobiales bacterium]|nr:hypothetical protein [Verrucomicrobiales bacterium]